MSEIVQDPALEGVSEELALLVRVFGIPQEEILMRVIEAGVDSVLADPEVSDIVARLHRLDARRGKRTAEGEGVAPAAAESRKASNGGRAQAPPRAPKPVVRVERADSLGVVERDAQDDDLDEPTGPLPAVTPQERLSAAKFVREVRMSRGITQSQLGERLGISGAYVSLLERADRSVGSVVVRKAVAWAKEHRAAA